MKNWVKVLLLFLILFAGGFFRIAHLNESSLWLDEGVTYYNSNANDFGGVWDRVAELDQSPPGYYFFMHGVSFFSGENEVIFRLTSVAFGLLTILFLYLLMTRLFDEEVGLISAALLAMNPFHVGFSMEARMYVLLAMEAVAGLMFLVNAILDDKRSFWNWLGLFVVLVAGLYTHTFFFFVVAGLGVVFLLMLPLAKNKFGKFWRAILTGALAFLVYVPWIPSFLRQLEVERYWMAENSFRDVKDYFIDFAGGEPLVLLVFLALIAGGLLWAFCGRKSVDYKKRVLGAVALIAFIVVSFGLPLVYSLFLEPILKIRYVVFVVPIFMGLVALGLYSIRRYSLIVMVAIFVALGISLAGWEDHGYPVEFGEDFRGLAESVMSEPGVLVVHTPSIAHVINFYNKGLFEVLPFPNSDDLTEYNISEDNKDAFLALVSSFDSFYLAISHTHENPPGLLFVWADSVCEESEELEITGIDFYRFSGCDQIMISPQESL